MDYHQMLGIVSALLVFGAGIPYIYDCLYGTTRPNSVSWFGWSLLLGSSFFIQLTNNPDYSVYFVGADFLIVVIIAILSCFRGVTQYSTLDLSCLALGFIGFFLWLGLNEPILALIANVVADAMFAIPTAIKAFKDPASESLRSWQIAASGMLLGLLSKTDFGLINTLFPLYIFLFNATMYALCTSIQQRLLGYQKIR